MEDWAIAFYSLRTEQQAALNMIFFIVGGILFSSTMKGSWEIERSPFFVYSAIIISLSYLPGVITWLTYAQALRSEATWLIVLQTAVIMVLCGYSLALVASARSRNAVGSNWMAVLAFIPVANLWLLFAPPRSDDSPALLRPPRLMRGEVGVILAIALIIASAVAGRLLVNLVRIDAEELVNADPGYAKSVIRRMIVTRGLPQTLKQIAENAKPPVSIDEVTVLSKIVALDNELFRTFTVDMEDLIVDEFLRRDNADYLCQHPSMYELLVAGAQVHEIFAAKSGVRFGQFTITADDCSVAS
jgi:hypothetical protein